MLHTVNQSPFSSHLLKTCISMVSPGDEILLLENGVYGVQHQLLNSCPCPVYAIEADLSARGLAEKARHVSVIDYAGYVDLCIIHQKQVAW